MIVDEKRYAMLWSGGKDSCLALWKAGRLGLRVPCLVNFFDQPSGRVRFHAVRRELIAAQAEALGLELRQLPTFPETYGAVFVEALAELADRGFAGVVGGDIHLADVRGWVEERAGQAGLRLVEPLWQQDGEALLRELVDAGFQAVVTCTDGDRLDSSWLGRALDAAFISDILKLPAVDPCGEHGEFHSFAFAGPLFRHAVAWRPGQRLKDGRFTQLDLLPEAPR